MVQPTHISHVSPNIIPTPTLVPIWVGYQPNQRCTHRRLAIMPRRPINKSSIRLRPTWSHSHWQKGTTQQVKLFNSYQHAIHNLTRSSNTINSPKYHTISNEIQFTRFIYVKWVHKYISNHPKKINQLSSIFFHEFQRFVITNTIPKISQ